MSWQEELKYNLTTASEASELLHLDQEEKRQLERILERFPMSVTRYYLSLIDWSDEEDPIRRMCIPSVRETDLSGSFDTSGEADNTVVTGMQHKYRETALVLSTNCCAMYCRHCFRKRLVGLSGEEVANHREEMVRYIENHREISNVLISGGDAFLNSNQIIRGYLEDLTGIEHLDLIRLGTRTPVVFPERITGDRELLEILGEYSRKKQIYVITHFNHPKELTKQAAAAVRGLLEAGVPVRNQTVLLKGVNDREETLAELLKGLTGLGVLPYYIFQCRPVTGVENQFSVPLLRGYEVVEAAKQKQNGLGKNMRYVFSHKTGKIEILGRLGEDRMLFKYHQAKNDRDASRMFTAQLGTKQTWIEEVPRESL